MRAAALALAPLLILTALVACEEDVPIAFRPGCEVLLETVTPDAVPLEGGGEAVVSGYWMASDQGVRDTLVRVGGEPAEVLDVAAVGCDLCVACSIEAVRCRECESVCRGETQWEDASGTVHEAQACTETVTFRVPPRAEPGEVEISVTTRHGEGSNLLLTYQGAGDDDDSAGDDDDSAGDDDDSAGDDDDSAE